MLHCVAESPKGTVGSATTDVLVWDLEINPTDPFIERKLSGKVTGHSSLGVLEGTKAGTCTFKAELRAGSAAWDVGLLVLMKACGMKVSTQTVTPTSVVATQETVSFKVYEDGLLKQMSGCMGNVVISPEGGRIICDFTFSGVWIAPTDIAMATVGHAVTLPMQWGNASTTFKVNAAEYHVPTFSFDLGNSVIPRFQGGRILHYLVADRDPTWTFPMEADGVATYDIFGEWLSGTPTTLEVIVTNGTDKFTFAVPIFQYRSLAETDLDGIAANEVIGQCAISVIDTGDDEFSIVAATA